MISSTMMIPINRRLSNIGKYVYLTRVFVELAVAQVHYEDQEAC